jgi:hypothetical protein
MSVLRAGLQVIAGSLLSAVVVAGASASVLSYQATCGPDDPPNFSVCADIGLSVGAGVSALFDLDTPGPDFAGLTLGKADVNFFSIAFGDVSFTSAGTNNWDFRLITNGAGTITQLKFLASEGVSGTYSETVDLRANRWFASTSADCLGGPCDLALAQTFVQLAGTGAEGLVSSLNLSAAVAEPGTLGLLGLGMAAGVGLRRRPKFTSSRG